MNIDTTTTNEKAVCRLCQTECRTEKVLEMHMKKMHPETVKTSLNAAAPTSTTTTTTTTEAQTKSSLNARFAAISASSSSATTATAAATTSGGWQENDDDWSSSSSSKGALVKGVGGMSMMDQADVMSEKDFSSLLSTLGQSRKVDDVAAMQKNSSSPLYSAKTFEEFNLSPELLKGIYKVGFSRPSGIQGKALPFLLKPQNGRFRNIIAQSQSGTGKTAAFALSLLNRIDFSMECPQALVLTPTRELTIQVATEIEKLGCFTPVKVFRAVSQSRAQGSLTEHVVVGTPGTVIGYISRKQFQPNQIRVFVLDEADEMLKMQSFGDQTQRIYKTLSPDVQFLFFSATFEKDMRKFASIIPDPIEIMVPEEELALERIRQYFIRCQGHDNKMELVESLYGLMTIGSSIIFCYKKTTADELAARMRSNGHTVALLHGGLEKSDRDSVMKDFGSSVVKVLICTNVLARGIDIPQVSLVINFDLPLTAPPEFKPDFETYLHRIGRTGRFGRLGAAINLIDSDRAMEKNLEIQRHFGRPIVELPSDLEELEKELTKAKLTSDD